MLQQSDTICSLYTFLEKMKKNNLVQSKVLATYNSIFGPEPREPLASKSISNLITLLANSIGCSTRQAPTKKDIATNHLLSMQLLIVRSLMAAVAKSNQIKSEAEQSKVSWLTRFYMEWLGLVFH
jgi:hypothetical protein